MTAICNNSRKQQELCRQAEMSPRQPPPSLLPDVVLGRSTPSSRPLSALGSPTFWIQAHVIIPWSLLRKWSSHSEPSISIEIIKQWCDLLEFTIRTLFQTWLLRCACVTSLWRKIHWCSCFANTPCKYCKSCQFSMMQHVCTYMKHPKTVFAGLGTLSSLKSLKLSRQPRQHASGYPRPSLEQVWCPEQTKTHGVVFILFEATSHNFS